MDSPADVHKRYLRFFAWLFVLATIVALSLFGAAVFFPPMPLPPYAPAVSVLDIVGFDGDDLRLLTAVAALIATLAFAGLVIATLQTWLEVRRARTRAAVESAVRQQERLGRRLRAQAAIPLGVE